MAAVTLAQFPGTQTRVEIPEGGGPFTLRKLLEQQKVDPNAPRTQTTVTVNGRATVDLDTELTDGSTVIVAVKVDGAA